MTMPKEAIAVKFSRLTARQKRLVRTKVNKGMRRRRASGQFRIMVRELLK